MAKRHAGEPVDADVDVGRRLAAAGDIQIAAAGRPTANEDRVEVLLEQGAQALDPLGEELRGA